MTVSYPQTSLSKRSRSCTRPRRCINLCKSLNSILVRCTCLPLTRTSWRAGSIAINPARHEVRVNGRQVHLTSIEFKLLQRLMQRRGRVQDRDRLLNEVWGYESVIDTRTVDTHVRRLREKLGKAGDVIETVRGFGYRLRES